MPDHGPCECGHVEEQHDMYPTVLDHFEEQCLVAGCTCIDFTPRKEPTDA